MRGGRRTAPVGLESRVQGTHIHRCVTHVGVYVTCSRMMCFAWSGTREACFLKAALCACAHSMSIAEFLVNLTLSSVTMETAVIVAQCVVGFVEIFLVG